MSFSFVLNISYRASENAQICINDDDVIIYNEDDMGNTIDEIYLPGLRIVRNREDCHIYHLPKMLSDDDVIYGSYAHKQDIKASLIDAIPALNEMINSRRFSILPGILMGGVIEKGHGGILQGIHKRHMYCRALDKKEILFRVTCGSYTQIVMKNHDIFMVHSGCVYNLNHRILGEIPKIDDYVSKIGKVTDAFADIIIM